MGRTAQLTTFVGQLPSSQLHGLALKLQNDAKLRDWSTGQEFLWNLCISELEHRWRQAPPLERCSCELCFSPFPDEPWCQLELPT